MRIISDPESGGQVWSEFLLSQGSDRQNLPLLFILHPLSLVLSP